MQYKEVLRKSKGNTDYANNWLNSYLTRYYNELILNPKRTTDSVIFDRTAKDLLDIDRAKLLGTLNAKGEQLRTAAPKPEPKTLSKEAQLRKDFEANLYQLAREGKVLQSEIPAMLKDFDSRQEVVRYSVLDDFVSHTLKTIRSNPEGQKFKESGFGTRPPDIKDRIVGKDYPKQRNTRVGEHKQIVKFSPEAQAQVDRMNEAVQRLREKDLEEERRLRSLRSTARTDAELTEQAKTFGATYYQIHDVKGDHIEGDPNFKDLKILKEIPYRGNNLFQLDKARTNILFFERADYLSKHSEVSKTGLDEPVILLRKIFFSKSYDPKEHRLPIQSIGVFLPESIALRVIEKIKENPDYEVEFFDSLFRTADKTIFNGALNAENDSIGRARSIINDLDPSFGENPKDIETYLGKQYTKPFEPVRVGPRAEGERRLEDGSRVPTPTKSIDEQKADLRQKFETELYQLAREGRIVQNLEVGFKEYKDELERQLNLGLDKGQKYFEDLVKRLRLIDPKYNFKESEPGTNPGNAAGQREETRKLANYPENQKARPTEGEIKLAQFVESKAKEHLETDFVSELDRLVKERRITEEEKNTFIEEFRSVLNSNDNIDGALQYSKELIAELNQREPIPEVPEPKGDTLGITERQKKAKELADIAAKDLAREKQKLLAEDMKRDYSVGITARQRLAKEKTAKAERDAQRAVEPEPEQVQEPSESKAIQPKQKIYYDLMSNRVADAIRVLESLVERKHPQQLDLLYSILERFEIDDSKGNVVAYKDIFVEAPRFLASKPRFINLVEQEFYERLTVSESLDNFYGRTGLELNTESVENLTVNGKRLDLKHTDNDRLAKLGLEGYTFELVEDRSNSNNNHILITFNGTQIEVKLHGDETTIVATNNGIYEYTNKWLIKKSAKVLASKPFDIYRASQPLFVITRGAEKLKMYYLPKEENKGAGAKKPEPIGPEPSKGAKPTVEKAPEEIVSELVDKLPDDIKRKVNDALKGKNIEFVEDPQDNELIQIEKYPTENKYYIPKEIIGNMRFNIRKNSLIIVSRGKLKIVSPEGRNIEFIAPNLNQRNISRVHGLFVLTDKGLIYSKLGRHVQTIEYDSYNYPGYRDYIGGQIGENVAEPGEKLTVNKFEPTEKERPVVEDESTRTFELSPMGRKGLMKLVDVYTKRFSATTNQYGKLNEVQPNTDAFYGFEAWLKQAENFLKIKESVFDQITEKHHKVRIDSLKKLVEKVRKKLEVVRNLDLGLIPEMPAFREFKNMDEVLELGYNEPIVGIYGSDEQPTVERSTLEYNILGHKGMLVNNITNEEFNSENHYVFRSNSSHSETSTGQDNAGILLGENKEPIGACVTDGVGGAGHMSTQVARQVIYALFLEVKKLPEINEPNLRNVIKRITNALKESYSKVKNQSRNKPGASTLLSTFKVGNKLIVMRIGDGGLVVTNGEGNIKHKLGGYALREVPAQLMCNGEVPEIEFDVLDFEPGDRVYTFTDGLLKEEHTTLDTIAEKISVVEKSDNNTLKDVSRALFDGAKQAAYEGFVYDDDIAISAFENPGKVRSTKKIGSEGRVPELGGATKSPNETARDELEQRLTKLFDNGIITRSSRSRLLRLFDDEIKTGNLDNAKQKVEDAINELLEPERIAGIRSENKRLKLPEHYVYDEKKLDYVTRLAIEVLKMEKKMPKVGPDVDLKAYLDSDANKEFREKGLELAKETTNLLIALNHKYYGEAIARDLLGRLNNDLGLFIKQNLLENKVLGKETIDKAIEIGLISETDLKSTVKKERKLIWSIPAELQLKQEQHDDLISFIDNELDISNSELKVIAVNAVLKEFADNAPKKGFLEPSTRSLRKIVEDAKTALNNWKYLIQSLDFEGFDNARIKDILQIKNKPESSGSVVWDEAENKVRYIRPGKPIIEFDSKPGVYKVYSDGTIDKDGTIIVNRTKPGESSELEEVIMLYNGVGRNFLRHFDIPKKEAKEQRLAREPERSSQVTAEDIRKENLRLGLPEDYKLPSISELKAIDAEIKLLFANDKESPKLHDLEVQMNEHMQKLFLCFNHSIYSEEYKKLMEQIVDPKQSDLYPYLLVEIMRNKSISKELMDEILAEGMLRIPDDLEILKQMIAHPEALNDHFYARVSEKAEALGIPQAKSARLHKESKTKLTERGKAIIDLVRRNKDKSFDDLVDILRARLNRRDVVVSTDPDFPGVYVEAPDYVDANGIHDDCIFFIPDFSPKEPTEHNPGKVNGTFLNFFDFVENDANVEDHFERVSDVLALGLDSDRRKDAMKKYDGKPLTDFELQMPILILGDSLKHFEKDTILNSQAIRRGILKYSPREPEAERVEGNEPRQDVEQPKADVKVFDEITPKQDYVLRSVKSNPITDDLKPFLGSHSEVFNEFDNKEYLSESKEFTIGEKGGTVDLGNYNYSEYIKNNPHLTIVKNGNNWIVHYPDTPRYHHFKSRTFKSGSKGFLFVGDLTKDNMGQKDYSLVDSSDKVQSFDRGPFDIPNVILKFLDNQVVVTLLPVVEYNNISRFNRPSKYPVKPVEQSKRLNLEEARKIVALDQRDLNVIKEFYNAKIVPGSEDPLTKVNFSKDLSERRDIAVLDYFISLGSDPKTIFTSNRSIAGIKILVEKYGVYVNENNLLLHSFLWNPVSISFDTIEYLLSRGLNPKELIDVPKSYPDNLVSKFKNKTVFDIIKEIGLELDLVAKGPDDLCKVLNIFKVKLKDYKKLIELIAKYHEIPEELKKYLPEASKPTIKGIEEDKPTTKQIKYGLDDVAFVNSSGQPDYDRIQKLSDIKRVVIDKLGNAKVVEQVFNNAVSDTLDYLIDETRNTNAFLIRKTPDDKIIFETGADNHEHLNLEQVIKDELGLLKYQLATNQMGDYKLPNFNELASGLTPEFLGNEHPPRKIIIGEFTIDHSKTEKDGISIYIKGNNGSEIILNRKTMRGNGSYILMSDGAMILEEFMPTPGINGIIGCPNPNKSPSKDAKPIAYLYVHRTSSSSSYIDDYVNIFRID